LKLAFCSIGITRILKVLERESKIKIFYPKKLMYFWFLGVDLVYQGNGKGSKLLKEIIDLANRNKLPLYLETSTEINLPLYNRNYLQIYNELNFNYPLYMLKKESE
jgi:GNAT superfamily N-acetyltransferase